jgi:glycosyltransferase involved in cell wall biosynthesis
MRMAEGKTAGYLLYGTEGEPRDPANIGYYHRADMLRSAAEKAGWRSEVVYNRKSPNDRSSLRRLMRSAWLRHKFANCDVVYAAGADAAGMAAFALRKTKTPVLYDVHTPAVGEKWLQFKLAKSVRNFIVYLEACVSEWMAIKYSDTILWCSSIQRDYYAKRGFPATRLAEVRHGVDLERFRPGNSKDEGTPLLCYAGTMVEYQGADRLVQAFEHVGAERVRLKMIGFTERDAQLRARAEKAGIETLEQVPHERLLEELRGCDCTCIVAHPDAVRYKNGAAPTKWPEGLALGRPIISGDAYDTAHLIRELRVGWVVENSSEGIASGLRALAESSREQRDEMGKRARAEAERHYGWETVGGAFVQALNAATKRT